MSQFLYTPTSSLPSLFLAVLLLICLVGFLLLFKQYILCRKGRINIRLTHDENIFNQELISLIPQLRCNYSPPCCFRNRIPITLLFGILGRFGSRQTNPVAVREKVPLLDGTNAVFDLFLEPLVHDPLLENIILLVIPGIFNHSESDYVRAYIEYASAEGFKVACLNHYGSNCGERLNPEAPRVHTYGGTGDFSKMIDYLRDKNPGVKFIGVGISVGANILLKYLGDRPERQSYFLCAQSWCQGYDLGACIPHMNKLWSGAKLINHLVTRKKKEDVSNNLHLLFGGPPARTNPVQNSLPPVNEPVTTPISDDESKPMLAISNPAPEISIAEVFTPLVDPPSHAPHSSVSASGAGVGPPLPSWAPTYAYQREGREAFYTDPPRDENGYLIEGWEAIPPFDINEFNRATNVGAIDSSLSRGLLGFQTRDDLYRWCGSAHVMDQIKDFPVLLVNSRDDPLIPFQVVEEIVSHHCRVNEKAIGILTNHGGHLGYYEGRCCSRNRISWMDKVSIRHAKSIIQMKLGDYADRV